MYIVSYTLSNTCSGGQREAMATMSVFEHRPDLIKLCNTLSVIRCLLSIVCNTLMTVQDITLAG